METYQALLEKRHLDLANWPPHLMNYTDRPKSKDLTDET